MTDKNLTISQRIDVLCDDVTNWETTELKASNQRLYDILGRCLELTAYIKVNRDRLNALNDVVKNRGLKFSGKTTTLRKVVKLVFGANRQRSSAYSLVLEAACEAGVQPQGLGKWLEQQGGIEEVRTGGSKSGASKANMRELGRKHLQSADPLAQVSQTKVKADSGYVVMVGYVDNNGDTNILAILEQEALLDQVAEKLGRQVFAEYKDQNKELTADDLIAELAQKALPKAA